MKLPKNCENSPSNSETRFYSLVHSWRVESFDLNWVSYVSFIIISKIFVAYYLILYNFKHRYNNFFTESSFYFL
jgi:hypothetical protein